MSCSFRSLRGCRFVVGVLSVLLATLAWAGTAGKLMGVVTDAKKAPLPGVAVTVEGTRLGASTDPDGRYLILQVPPGIHTVKAQLIGFRTTKVAKVRVSADLTSQVSFTIEEESIKMDAMVVTAKRAIIEQDVTSSQIIVDAKSVEDMPVSQMLDMLSYEPGVSVSANDELNIRGGGASEIRFQVDGMDRTDAITSKGQSHLNQVLVSEVTVLTGGFNAEYGNVRSGVVNAVLKDGTERGFGLPWIAGAVSYLPTQKKHFGEGAYDADQYDYWLMSSKSPFDTTALQRAMYWPELYAETRADTTLMKDFQKSNYKVFDGWTKAASIARFAGLGKGAYGSKGWSPEAAREAWEWEANMDEQVWEYAHKPDINVDLAMGWALPAKLGGIVVGYSYNRQTTAVPALIPESISKAFEAKLTLTPIDELKMSIRVSRSRYSGTGAGDGDGARDPELTTVAPTEGGDPVKLTSSGDLASSLSGTVDGKNKLNLSYNQPLIGEYDQIGAMVTYTFNPTTFATLAYSWSQSKWDTERDAPRAEIANFTDKYVPGVLWGYGDWLGNAYRFSDVWSLDSLGSPIPGSLPDGRGDPPINLEDALTPGRMIKRTPFAPEVYRSVPSESQFNSREFAYTNLGGNPDTVVLVSSQGWVQDPYKDLSVTYGLGSGGKLSMLSKSTSWSVKADVTRAMGAHTIKIGGEAVGADVESVVEKGSGVFGAVRNTNYRDYGGLYPSCKPLYAGFFLQDKYETDGMVANVGIRLERFDGGQKAMLYDDLFNATMFSTASASGYREEAAKDMLIAADVDWWTDGDPIPGYEALLDSIGVAPGPWTVAHYVPGDDAKSYWRFAPRFGIAHPVTEKTKFFFNFGQFYSMQKAAVMFGYASHNRRPGADSNSRFNDMYNPSLRPAKTTMYEVGAEHVLPLQVLVTARGYAKYNVDQVASLNVGGTADGVAGATRFDNYRIFRNTDYEDIKGAEIKISRGVGRFVNGWFTFERFNSRSGFVGLVNVDSDPLRVKPFDPSDYQRESSPQDAFQAGIVFSTPRGWGQVQGNWNLTIVQSYRSGGEVMYNPTQLEPRELPEEAFIPVVPTWETSMKLSKRFALPGRRSLMAYVDVSNPFNRKRMNGSGLSSVASANYLEHVYTLRQEGSDVKYGDSSTFNVFSEPYKDSNDIWQPPIAPGIDWLLFQNRRLVRFGMTFSL